MDRGCSGRPADRRVPDLRLSGDRGSAGAPGPGGSGTHAVSGAGGPRRDPCWGGGCADRRGGKQKEEKVNQDNSTGPEIFPGPVFVR